ncbi:MAG: hypothetical protein OEM91_06370 [Hyphomicrobiales bacterium]|nr:hypothetical protein [Hyphomicrobiales bacterium]
MRKGLVISLGLHAAILFWSVAVFPAARDLNAPKIQPVPVDIVSATEFTKIKAGKRDAKEVKPAASKKPDKPKPVAKKKTPKPKPKKAKAAPKKKVAKKAEPAPKVKKAKAKPAPKPKPKKKVAAKKSPKKKTSPTIERKPKKNSFDADRIAALLDKAPDGGSTASLAPVKKPANKPKPNKPSRGVAAGRDVTMSLSEIDALRARISQCWNPPTGGLGADALKVKLRLRLGRDGMLSGRPEVVNKGASPFFVAAADSAVRAVMLCQPYQLPAAKYALWRDMILNFDPREMFGG